MTSFEDEVNPKRKDWAVVLSTSYVIGIKFIDSLLVFITISLQR